MKIKNSTLFNEGLPLRAFFIFLFFLQERPKNKAEQLQSVSHTQETQNVKSDNQQQQIQSLKTITRVIKMSKSKVLYFKRE